MSNLLISKRLNDRGAGAQCRARPPQAEQIRHGYQSVADPHIALRKTGSESWIGDGMFCQRRLERQQTVG